MPKPALTLFLTLLLAVLAICTSATASGGVTAPCTESAGAKIHLAGNGAICYLVGRRMRKGSVYAQCKDGELSCFADEGIPDKPARAVPCVAPENGNCGSA